VREAIAQMSTWLTRHAMRCAMVTIAQMSTWLTRHLARCGRHGARECRRQKLHVCTNCIAGLSRSLYAHIYTTFYICIIMNIFQLNTEKVYINAIFLKIPHNPGEFSRFAPWLSWGDFYSFFWLFLLNITLQARIARVVSMNRNGAKTPRHVRM